MTLQWRHSECSIFSESVINIWSCFSHSQDIWIKRSSDENGVTPLPITSSNPLGKVCFPFLKLCWFRDLSSQNKNASTKWHINDSIKVETETANWSVWVPHVSKPTENGDNWSDWSYLIKTKLVGYSKMRAGRSMSKMQEFPWSAS